MQSSEPNATGSTEPEKKPRKNRKLTLELAPEVIEDLKRRYGVEDEPDPNQEPELEPAPYSPPPKPIEEIVVDTVGSISPVVLGLGVIGGLLIFILLITGIVLFVLYSGVGISPLPSDPIIESFDSGESENWDVWVLEGEANESDGESTILQEATFDDGGYRLTNGQSDVLFWSSAGLRIGPGIYEVDVTFETVEADTGAGIAVQLDDDNFILFEIDPSGYVWIGTCEAACAVATPLTGGGWYYVDEINSEFWAVNRLKLSVKQGSIIAYINDEEIGFAEDAAIDGIGDIAFVVEAGETGETSVVFDNFVWSPHP